MTAETPLFETNFTVGKCYRVSMTVQRPVLEKVTHLVCEWDPFPQELKPWELEEYRVNRNAALAALGERLGGEVVCVEL